MTEAAFEKNTLIDAEKPGANPAPMFNTANNVVKNAPHEVAGVVFSRHEHAPFGETIHVLFAAVQNPLGHDPAETPATVNVHCAGATEPMQLVMHGTVEPVNRLLLLDDPVPPPQHGLHVFGLPISSQSRRGATRCRLERQQCSLH